MKLKRWMKLLLGLFSISIGFTLVPMCPLSAYQEIGEAVSREEHDTHFSSGWMSQSSGHGVFYMNGDLVYCIEPYVYFNQDARYHMTHDYPHIQKDDQITHFESLTQEENHLLGLLSHYGYGYQDDVIDHTDWRWYFITQACIWYTLSHQWERSIVYEDQCSLEPEMEALWNLATHYMRDIPSFDGQEITLNVGESITLTDENHVLQRFQIEITDGFEVTKNGSELTIKATQQSPDIGCIELVNHANKSLQNGLSIFYVWSSSNHQAAYQTCAKPIYNGQSAHMSILVKVNQLGSLKIIKEDDEHDHFPLPNASFEITGPNHYCQTQMTQEDGTITLIDLVPGKYTIKEKHAPFGYLIDSKVYEVDVVAGKEVALAIQNRQPTGAIHLCKEDQETKKQAQGDATLAGAQYRLYAKEDIWDASHTQRFYEKDEVVHVFETDIQGDCLAKEGLPLGNYYLKEIKAPEGYVLDTQIYDISLDYRDQKTDVIWQNLVCQDRIKKQAFQIIKICQQNDGKVELLAGAQFTVKLASDVEKNGWEKAAVYDVLTSDEKGYACSKELPYGRYIVKETRVPENYYPVDDFFIDIDEDSREPQTWRILNDMAFEAMIQLVKVDKETGKTVHIAGTTFKIKNLDTGEYVGKWSWYPHPQYITEFVTDDTGMVTLPETLEYGHYQLEEVKAPYGYHLDDPILYFDLQMNKAYSLSEDEGAFLLKVVKENTSTKGRIQIHKSGQCLVGIENGQFIYEERGLKDVVFEIRAKVDIFDPANHDEVIYHAGEIIETVITNEAGQALSSNLPLGSYVVQEIQSAKGYLMDHQCYDVDLLYQDQETHLVEVKLDLYNERQKVILNIHKKDGQTQLPLAGATLALYAHRDIKNIDGDIIVAKDMLLKEAVSDQEGFVDFNMDLPLDLSCSQEALFRIEEIEAPKGYILSKDVFYVDTNLDIMDASLTMNKTFFNFPTLVRIMKKDAYDGHLLTGAQLQVLDKQTGKVIREWKTTENIEEIRGLEIGKTYILKEMEAPLHYALMDDVEWIVQDTLVPQEIVLLDKRTYQIEIHKQDASTKQSILSKDMIFKLYYDESGKLPVVGINLFYENGNMIFSHLQAGTYYLKEIEPPKGYLIKEETVRIDIDEGYPAGYRYEMVIENDKIPVEKVPTGDDIRVIYMFIGIGISSCILFYFWVYQKRKNVMN